MRTLSYLSRRFLYGSAFFRFLACALVCSEPEFAYIPRWFLDFCVSHLLRWFVYCPLRGSSVFSSCTAFCPFFSQPYFTCGYFD